MPVNTFKLFASSRVSCHFVYSAEKKKFRYLRSLVKSYPASLSRCQSKKHSFFFLLLLFFVTQKRDLEGSGNNKHEPRLVRALLVSTACVCMCEPVWMCNKAERNTWKCERAQVVHILSLERRLAIKKKTVPCRGSLSVGCFSFKAVLAFRLAFFSPRSLGSMWGHSAVDLLVHSNGQSPMQLACGSKILPEF